MIAAQQQTDRDFRPPPNILVMEDEFSVAKGLEMVLTEEGYLVDLAMSGQAALDTFDKKQFDLLVADLRLPDIDGVEVIRRVREKHPELRKYKTAVFLTAHPAKFPDKIRDILGAEPPVPEKLKKTVESPDKTVFPLEAGDLKGLIKIVQKARSV